MVSIDDLNEEQRGAVEAIARFLDDPRARYFGLFGPAGTGKTTTIGVTLRGRMESIAFSAPTHKAAGVLAEKAPPGIECYTIHRLLACRKYYDREKGEIEFRPTPGADSFGDYDLIVIDEASMVGETMFSWIDEAASASGTKIIFLGDRYQLPPVKDGDESPAFSADLLGDHVVDLEVIMRHGGMIQDACNGARQAIISGRRPPLIESAGEDTEGRITIFKNTETGIGEFFEYFMEEPLASKALAFRNDDVNFMNGYLRKMLYGVVADKEPFIPGERLVLVSTYESPTSGGIYHTETECVLEDVSRDRRLDLECYRLYLTTDYGAGFEAFAFGGKAQRAAYVRKLRALQEEGKAGLGWKPYFKLKERFASLRPGYATTIHKSQGSTYSRVFLLQSELVGMWDKTLLARLLYVAYSRASREIVVI